MEKTLPYTPDKTIQRPRFLIDSPSPLREEIKSGMKISSVLDKVNDIFEEYRTPEVRDLYMERCKMGMPRREISRLHRLQVL